MFGDGKQKTFTEISIEEYRVQFEGKEHALIDVREEEEYEDGHVPGAVNVPMSVFQMRLDEIPKDTPVVMVCRTGQRSAMTSQFLGGQGFTDIYNLMGGTKRWDELDLPLEYPED